MRFHRFILRRSRRPAGEWPRAIRPPTAAPTPSTATTTSLAPPSVFPHHIGTGATRDPGLVKRAEQVTRATAKHYVGDGGTTFGTGSGNYLTDQGDTRIS